jgi:hypothetical protein
MNIYIQDDKLASSISTFPLIIKLAAACPLSNPRPFSLFFFNSQVLRLLDDAKAGRTLGSNSLAGNKRVSAVSPFHSSTVSFKEQFKKMAATAAAYCSFINLLLEPYVLSYPTDSFRFFSCSHRYHLKKLDPRHNHLQSHHFHLATVW